MDREKSKWVWADLNGLFGEVLCLSHKDFSADFEDNRIARRAGMKLAAFMEDLNEKGQHDDLFAPGSSSQVPNGCPAEVRASYSESTKMVST